MIQLSVNLPKKYRLDVHLVHSRREESIAQPMLPRIREIRSVRKGSKFSRIFTHIFSHKSIRRVFGANIALFIVATSFVPVKANFDIFDGTKIVSTSNVVTTTEKGIRYPVDSVKVTQGYSFFHPGVDLDGITGDPIYPLMAGKVKAIQFSRFAYGNAILIGHGDGIDSLYAHLSKINVREGEEVTIKTEIGEMGATGHASGDHLHFEIMQDGRSINPFVVLPKVK